jgi:fumarate reductase subunit C
MEARLFILQRLTAMIMAPLVILHLIVIMMAVRGGLTAGEIQARLDGNLLWAGFYGLFVVCAALHAPIGLRNVLREWSGLGARAVDLCMIAFAALLLVAGLRAVFAVTGGWS